MAISKILPCLTLFFNNTAIMRFINFFPVLVWMLIWQGCGSVRIGNADNDFAVIAYYAGNAENVSQFPVEKLTHIIFSFCHLQGNRLAVDNEAGSQTIRKLVSLKARNPKLNVLLSLGGWGGCQTCSQVFNTAAGRTEFCQSVKDLANTYQTDGLDLDWEYPAIEGYPGHQFLPEDKQNFTALVKELRQTLGNQQIISFAAGGFNTFLEQSIEWDKAMPYLDMVNVMSYDLTNGFSPATGHHTPLYSTPDQPASTDNAVRFLDSIGLPTEKIVIGAAFYARVWEGVDSVNHGLYRPGKFKRSVSYRSFNDYLSDNQGFVHYWDNIAQAPFCYNAAEKLFATFDDVESVKRKTEYALQKKLGGIMFWQLGEDNPKGGLLDAIFETKSQLIKRR